MRLWSEGWTNGEPIPERYAAARLAASGDVEVSDNLSPPLAWSALPDGTRSLALLCSDFDVPRRAGECHLPGGEMPAEIPADAPREEFFHWVLVDLPAGLDRLAEGDGGCGFVARGKPQVAGPYGARQGLNDCTARFAGDAAMAGQYFGYDGPSPPSNDALVHHVVFTLYALAVERLAVAGAFTGAQVRAALAEHVLGSATHSGTYTLNPRLVGRMA